ncbi:MAG: HD domain-containing protein [Nanoarchaeota archaeon]
MASNIIVPRTEIETRIVSNPEFQESIGFIHNPEIPETINAHICNCLDYTDFLQIQEHTEQLRLLALLHDFGKFKTRSDENGKLISLPSAKISRQFAEQFITDHNLLKIIGFHDRHIDFYESALHGNFDAQEFSKYYVFSYVNLELLTLFGYVDSCEGNREAIKWLDDTLYKSDVSKNIVHKKYPKALVLLKDVNK